MPRRVSSRRRRATRTVVLAALSTGLVAAAAFGAVRADVFEGEPAGPATRTTAAAPTPPLFRFAVKGDWGSGSRNQAAVTGRMCARHDRSPFAFVLTTGDNFYPLGKATAGTYGRPERCLRDRKIPWRAAWGNHDVPDDSTGRVLGTPGRYYSFARGPVRVVVLDTNNPSSATQRRFLDQVLRDAKEPIRIVAFHHPLRTAGLHEPYSTTRGRWEPIFIRNRVSLVLQGHNHLYERIRVPGLTYVTTGGGGAGLYPCIRRAAGLVKCISKYHFLEVTVRADSVSVQAVTPDGAILDSFTVRPPVPAAP